jgi:hypothetical protein
MLFISIGVSVLALIICVITLSVVFQKDYSVGPVLTGDESYVKYIRIAGNEYAATVRYKDVISFLKNYNKTLQKMAKKYGAEKKVESLIVPNKFFFNIVWKCLYKSGVWPKRRPFRSKRHMVSMIQYEDLESIIFFVSRFILNYEPAGDKKKQQGVS